MRKEYLSIIKALSTVFFQEGFDRKENKHGLEYWSVNDEELKVHCRQCKICEHETVAYLLNTVNMNGQWYLRVFSIEYDEYDNQEIHVDLLIPVDTERLCWEEMSKCAQLIVTTLFPYLDD